MRQTSNIIGKKEGEADCYVCHKQINLEKQKFTLLATCNLDSGSSDELIYFHFPCFIEYHNKKTGEKAQNMIGSVIERVARMLPKDKHIDVEIVEEQH